MKIQFIHKLGVLTSQVPFTHGGVQVGTLQTAPVYKVCEQLQTLGKTQIPPFSQGGEQTAKKNENFSKKKKRNYLENKNSQSNQNNKHIDLESYNIHCHNLQHKWLNSCLKNM